jgi:hypothetical protein
MAIVTPNTRPFVLTTGQVRQLDRTALSLALVGVWHAHAGLQRPPEGRHEADPRPLAVAPPFTKVRPVCASGRAFCNEP